MAMKKVIVFASEQVVEQYDRMARQCGRKRSALMRLALENHVETLRSQLPSLRREGLSDVGAGAASRSRRRASGRKRRAWEVPRDWDAVDQVVDTIDNLLGEHPEWDRAVLRRELESTMGIDPGGSWASVVDRALDEVLGPVGAEFPRPLTRGSA